MWRICGRWPLRTTLLRADIPSSLWTSIASSLRLRGTCQLRPADLSSNAPSKAVALQGAFTRTGANFSIIPAGMAFLIKSSEELVQRVGCIEELLLGMGMLCSDMSITGHWYGKWLYTDLETLPTNAAILQSVFSPEEVRLIVRAQPNMLYHSECRRQKSLLERLQASFAAVAESLEMPASDAAETAARFPNLLRVKPETIRGTVAVLLRIPELVLVALALGREYPQILARNPLEIAKKWQSLRHLTAQHPEWHFEWQQWPKQLATLHNVLTFPLRHHQRLNFLSDSRFCGKELARSRKASSWLGMPDSRFKKLCPNYQQWLKQSQ